MKEQPEQLQRILEEAERNRGRLDKKNFHMTSLLETSRELSGVNDLDKLIHTFLLSIMGTCSMGSGFILFCDRESKAYHAVYRGVADEKHFSWETADKLVFDCFNVSKERRITPFTVSTIVNMKPFSAIDFPFVPVTALFYVIESQALGVIALGNPLMENLFTEDEAALLATLTAGFIIHIRNARAVSTIERLNENLEIRNRELEQTIRELTEARKTISALEKFGETIRNIIRQKSERLSRASRYDFILILLFSLTIGILYNMNSPNGVTLVPPYVIRTDAKMISVAEAVSPEYGERSVIVDARPAEFYREEHIKSAVNMPPAIFDFIYLMKFSNLPVDTPIIIYGRNISKHYDEEVAYKFQMRAHKTVRILDGGVSAWKKSGYEVESDDS